MTVRRTCALAALSLILCAAGLSHAQEADGQDSPSASAAQEADSSPAATPTRPRTYLGVGVGSGFGLATADGVIYGEDTSTESGFAFSPVQLYLEAGRVLIPRLELVLSGQFQLVFLDSGIEIVPRVRAAARYQVLERDRWSLGVQAGGGYGYQVHYVKLDDTFVNSAGESETITDTDRTKEGPVHLGAGAHFRFAFNDQLGLFADAFIMGMFPETSVHLDVNVGLSISF